MPSPWIEALKEWNAKHNPGKWCVAKKGTKEHAEVRAIMDRMKKGGKGGPSVEEEDAAIMREKKLRAERKREGESIYEDFTAGMSGKSEKREAFEKHMAAEKERTKKVKAVREGLMKATAKKRVLKALSHYVRGKQQKKEDEEKKWQAYLARQREESARKLAKRAEVEKRFYDFLASKPKAFLAQVIKELNSRAESDDPDDYWTVRYEPNASASEMIEALKTGSHALTDMEEIMAASAPKKSVAERMAEMKAKIEEEKRKRAAAPKGEKVAARVKAIEAGGAAAGAAGGASLKSVLPNTPSVERDREAIADRKGALVKEMRSLFDEKESGPLSKEKEKRYAYLKILNIEYLRKADREHPQYKHMFELIDKGYSAEKIARILVPDSSKAHPNRGRQSPAAVKYHMTNETGRLKDIQDYLRIYLSS